MAALRLSFVQKRGAFEPGAICVPIAKPLIFHLKTGQRIVLRAPNATIRVFPPTENVDGTYPWLYITFAGSTLVADREVRFQLANVRAPYAQVCAQPGLVRAARLAGERAYPSTPG